MDPANYLTAPSLAWDAMLRHTRVKLDLIRNSDILLRTERVKRGGVGFDGSKVFVKAKKIPNTEQKEKMIFFGFELSVSS